MEQEVYTIKDFCRCYAISRTAVYREVWDGRLRIVKRGRRTLITKLDADIWVGNLRDSASGALQRAPHFES